MTRFVAFRSRAYDTWHMRIVLALLALGAAAMAPLRADAFDLEASLKTLHVQYQGEPGLQVYVHVSGGLVFGRKGLDPQGQRAPSLVSSLTVRSHDHALARNRR